MRKHRYGYSMANLMGFVCDYCGHVTSLSAWQVETMPADLARCPKSPVRAGILERLFLSIDCLAREPFMEREPSADAMVDR